jgi:hypothetical protein
MENQQCPYLYEETMYEEIQRKVGWEAIMLFLQWLKQNYHHKYLPLWWSYWDVMLVTIFWMLSYPKNSTMREIYHIRESTFGRIYSWIFSKVKTFINQ